MSPETIMSEKIIIGAIFTLILFMLGVKYGWKFLCTHLLSEKYRWRFLGVHFTPNKPSYIPPPPRQSDYDTQNNKESSLDNEEVDSENEIHKDAYLYAITCKGLLFICIVKKDSFENCGNYHTLDQKISENNYKTIRFRFEFVILSEKREVEQVNIV